MDFDFSGRSTTAKSRIADADLILDLPDSPMRVFRKYNGFRVQASE